MARHTFFSYHYKPDVWRAWNVRNSWVGNPETQKSVGFFDSSVFEASRKESADSLKQFLRKGLEGTSVTCVLAGTATHGRRWVRYEIARSVVKGNGLLGRVDKRDSQGVLNVIQAGICDGDQLGTRPDVGRGMGVSRAFHLGRPRPERAQTHEPSPCSGWDFLDRTHRFAVA